MYPVFLSGASIGLLLFVDIDLVSDFLFSLFFFRLQDFFPVFGVVFMTLKKFQGGDVKLVAVKLGFPNLFPLLAH